MKSMILVALALVAVAAAAPASPAANDGNAQTLRSEFDQQPDGPYRFLIETDNSITRQEEGKLKEVVNEDNKPQNVIVVSGSYSYLSDNGQLESITYYADDTGYHAEGPSIPKAARR